MTLYKKRRGTKTLSGLSGDAIGKLARARGFYESAIITNWNSILPEYAKFTCPLKLFQGKLTIATNSPSAAHNIKMQGPYLIQRINQFFGYGAVKELAFRIKSFDGTHRDEKVTPLEVAEDTLNNARCNCSDIPDEDLRESLARLKAMIDTEKQN